MNRILFSLRRFEAFLMIERRRKAMLPVFFLLLFMPQQLRMLVVFFLATSLLGKDIRNRRIEMFLELPFTRTVLFVYSWALGAGVIVLWSAIYPPFMQGWTFSAEPLILLVFFTTYFSVSTIAACLRLDHMIVPVITIIGELVAGAIFGDSGLFARVSPLYHQSLPLSGAVAAIVFMLAWTVFRFNKRGC